MRHWARVTFRVFAFGGIPRLIHLLMGVSLVGIAAATAALVLILSVFNGFTQLVEGLYNRMEPHLQIEPLEGKWLELDSVPVEALRRLPGVVAVSPQMEVKALLQYGNEQVLAVVRGVSPEYVEALGIDSVMVEGRALLQAEGRPWALVGAGVARRLGVTADPLGEPLRMIFPHEPRKGLINPAAAFRKRPLPVAGVFSVQQAYDQELVLVPYQWLVHTLQVHDRADALVMRLKSLDADSLAAMRHRVAQLVGSRYEVTDFYRLHELLFRIFNIEKLAVFLILTLVMALAGFNVSGAVLMTAMARRRHLAVLQVMGASRKFLRGMMVGVSVALTLVGGGVGLVVGYGVGRLQQEYGWVQMAEGSTFVARAYPVHFEAADFWAVFAAIVLIGLAASVLPARSAASPLHLEKLRMR